MAAWNIRGFNHPDKVFACKKLIQSFRLDLICILENRINVLSLQDPFFDSMHSVLPSESSCHNFHLNSSGRIWIKWNNSKLGFTPSLITSQLITGIITVANQPILQLSAIYASNNPIERKALWVDISHANHNIHLPWALMGDYNCCRFAKEKIGGTPISISALTDFNEMIFLNGFKDLKSIGFNYSWYNQRTDNPIHIRLDRVLVNDIWLDTYADSYCSIQNPSCSDHSPIILHSGMVAHVHHRFLFKNYWSKLDNYWALLMEIFSKPCSGNPLSHLTASLKLLKDGIKKEAWSNSNCVKLHLDALLDKQKELLGTLHSDPNNLMFIRSYKEINAEIANFTSFYNSWVIQRAKVNWLKRGEDDLKFLYAKIRARRGANNSVVNLLSTNPNTSRPEIIKNITDYFQQLYNPIPPTNLRIDLFPVGIAVPDDFVFSCTSIVSDLDIKSVVFKGKPNSSLGPDGFNFYFYKSAWHIIGPVVCRAIRSFFSKCYMPNGVKATVLAIIPKHKNAMEIADFRPIALCNSLYKIIVKVLAERLKPIMKFSFVPFISSRLLKLIGIRSITRWFLRQIWGR
ncbi:uncharacterized protein LOC110110552 [Dendrobium catenatum]|nr:uncharacterized protein LOC110110552 [Dendrobium catenatum]